MADMQPLAPNRRGGATYPHLSDMLPTFRKWHIGAVIFAVPFMLIVIVLAAVFSYIGAKLSTQDDPAYEFGGENGTWEGCITAGNNAQIEIVIPQLEIDVQQDLAVASIPKALASQGMQSVVFFCLSAAVTARSYYHPSWLPSSVIFGIYTIIAQLTFYTANPIIGIPKETNSTLLSCAWYTKPSRFKGADNCQKAYDIMWSYYSLEFILIGINVFITGMSFYAEKCRQHTPNRRKYPPLQNTTGPLVVLICTIVFYFVTLAGKMIGTFNVLYAIDQLDSVEGGTDDVSVGLSVADRFFPFKEATLDISSILFILSFMSVIRGYTRESLSSFRLAAVTAAVFIVTMWPGMVGNMRLYKDEKLWKDSGCEDFTQTPPQSVYYGSPNDNVSKAYCTGFQLSVAGALGIFFLMHVQCLLCLRTFQSNPSDRESLVYDPHIEDPINPGTSANAAKLLDADSYSVENQQGGGFPASTVYTSTHNNGARGAQHA